MDTAVVMVDRLTSVAGLAFVLDAANGFADGKSLHTALFAWELAHTSGHAHVANAAFFAGLLRHLGCTAYAAEEAQLGDDVALRLALHQHRPPAAAVGAANTSSTSRAVGLARLLVSAGRMRREWTAEACAAAGTLTRALGFDDDVVAGVTLAFERFDGVDRAAQPLHLVARLATVAHTAVVFSRTVSTTRAREVLRADAGGALDPALALAACELLSGWRDDDEALVSAVLEAVASALPACTPLQLATTFGDFADLQSPWWCGHSRAVANIAADLGERVGLSAPEQQTLLLAAHLHDLGAVAVSTTVWQRRSWSSSDRALANSHSDHGARVLRLCPDFVGAAEVVADHHERLDGSGPQRRRQPQLGLPARVLAVADVWAGVQQARPHRAALRPDEARAFLVDEARAGRLDGDVVRLCCEPRTKTVAPPSTTLTAREVEVLQLVASGLTNKEVATRLSLSPRTVQHHTIHIYEKLGVNTRAAATLWAAQRGLLTSLSSSVS